MENSDYSEQNRKCLKVFIKIQGKINFFDYNHLNSRKTNPKNFDLMCNVKYSVFTSREPFVKFCIAIKETYFISLSTNLSGRPLGNSKKLFESFSQ